MAPRRPAAGLAAGPKCPPAGWRSPGGVTRYANDMVAGRRGSACVGNFGFDPMGRSPFATASLAWGLPSGGKDGGWGRPHSGRVGNRLPAGRQPGTPSGGSRPAATPCQLTGRPRGCCLGGQILSELPIGGMNAYACVLGGPDGRSLFVCVAPDFDGGCPHVGGARTAHRRTLTRGPASEPGR